MAIYAMQEWCLAQFVGDPNQLIITTIPDYTGLPIDPEDPEWWILGSHSAYLDGTGGVYSDESQDLTSRLYTTWTPSMPGANQYASCAVRNLSTPSNPSYAGICLRCDQGGTSHCYALLYDSSISGWRLCRQAANVTTTLATYTAAGQSIPVGGSGSAVLICNGTQISAVTNGVVQAPITDATISAAGGAGIAVLPHAGDDPTHGLHVAQFLAAYLP